MRFKSLSAKITFWTITVMLLIPAIVGVIIIVKQRQLGVRFSETITESDNILKATLLRDLEHAMMVNQLDGVREVLGKVGGFEGVRGVYLVDPLGRTVLSSGNEGGPYLTAGQLDTLFVKGREVSLFTNEGGESQRLIALPIKNKAECRVCHTRSEVNGALVIRQRSVDVRSETDFLAATMLIALLAASLGVSLTLLTMLRKEVVSPIRELSEATERVGHNDLDVRVPVQGEDELSELAQSFNRMTGDLKKSRDEAEDRRVKCEQAYLSMQAANRKLVQSEKLASIGSLAAGMAHEINNPVGIIAARTDCMIIEAKEKGLDPQIVEDLMVINRHSGRIADITRSLLTFARQSHAEHVPLDVNSVVEDALFLIEKQLVKEGIRLVRDLSPASPRVMGNGNRLQQVLLDLINNARDAMKDGGTVTVKTGGQGGRVEITVADTGEGIDEETIDKIFDPFFTTKEVGKGTGLGLAVAYGIIEDMGGTIEVRSVKGKGASFTISLPELLG